MSYESLTNTKYNRTGINQFGFLVVEWEIETGFINKQGILDQLFTSHYNDNVCEIRNRFCCKLKSTNTSSMNCIEKSMQIKKKFQRIILEKENRKITTWFLTEHLSVFVSPVSTLGKKLVMESLQKLLIFMM